MALDTSWMYSPYGGRSTNWGPPQPLTPPASAPPTPAPAPAANGQVNPMFANISSILSTIRPNGTGGFTGGFSPPAPSAPAPTTPNYPMPPPRPANLGAPPVQTPAGSSGLSAPVSQPGLMRGLTGARNPNPQITTAAMLNQLFGR